MIAWQVNYIKSSYNARNIHEIKKITKRKDFEKLCKIICKNAYTFTLSRKMR